MRRSTRLTALAAALAGLVATGCQDYRFTPVQRCLIQPGSSRVSLSATSAADVLFVVDDSGSMGGEQARLATAFDSFVGSLNAYNDTRAAAHLEPFDFHIAITTSSVFYDKPTSYTCKASCGTSANVCGVQSGTTCVPMRIAKTCPTGGGCGAGFACKTSCSGYAGEQVCCDASGATVETTTVACTTADAPCGAIQNRYAFSRQPVTCSSAGDCASGNVCTTSSRACGSAGYPSAVCCAPRPCTSSTDCAAGYACGSCEGQSGICCAVASPNQPQGTTQLELTCDPGVGVDGGLYPQGSFVGIGTNPRVLHFDKSLYATDANHDGFWDPVANPSISTNAQGFTRAQLKAFFAANVKVGTCGSGQEQGLQAGRLAVQKALSGQQKDVRDAAGNPVAAPGVTAAWPHAGGKLVVVYVGDEDDCSSPSDPVRGLILTGSPPADSCQADHTLPVEQQKEFRVGDVMSDLLSLNRPVGGAFIVSAKSNESNSSCQDASCLPAICTDSSCTEAAAVCGGQAPGSRFLEAADALRGGGADVVAASICDSQFGSILGRIAEIVKPPSALKLPTTPSSAEMTLLRITDAAGQTRKICRGPAPFGLTFDEAVAQGFDWWFTQSSDQTMNKTPWHASEFVYVNHATLKCEPNPGEGYSADYLSVLPAGGCASDADCTQAFGTASQWTCFAGTDAAGVCVAPTTTAQGKTGTCLCGTKATICPKG